MWWCVPVISATFEAEGGTLLELMEVKAVVSHDDLDDRVRPCERKKERERERENERKRERKREREREREKKERERKEIKKKCYM